MMQPIDSGAKFGNELPDNDQLQQCRPGLCLVLIDSVMFRSLSKHKSVNCWVNVKDFLNRRQELCLLICYK